MFLFGKFEPPKAKEATVKTFCAYGDLVVTVNVQCLFVLHKGKLSPNEIQLAIGAASHKSADNFFDSVDSAQASTALKRNWNLTTSKSIGAENKIYTFKLGYAEAKFAK